MWEFRIVRSEEQFIWHISSEIKESEWERIILSFILNLTQVNKNKHLREFRQWAKEFLIVQRSLWCCANPALMFRSDFVKVSLWSPLLCVTSQTTLAAAAVSCGVHGAPFDVRLPGNGGWETSKGIHVTLTGSQCQGYNHIKCGSTAEKMTILTCSGC